jgi:hypothetical protein
MILLQVQIHNVIVEDLHMLTRQDVNVVIKIKV